MPREISHRWGIGDSLCWQRSLANPWGGLADRGLEGDGCLVVKPKALVISRISVDNDPLLIAGQCMVDGMPD